MKNLKYFGAMCLLASVGAVLFSEIVEITTGYSGFVDSILFGVIVGLSWDNIAPRLGLGRE
tara:strand:+ start:77 stop:259 length:183 start_codon:yes stop_codon:yes gene_type:complete